MNAGSKYLFFFFQKHNAKCNSGITVNLCYYKCASFPLLRFYMIGKTHDSVLYNITSSLY